MNSKICFFFFSLQSEAQYLLTFGILTILVTYWTNASRLFSFEIFLLLSLMSEKTHALCLLIVFSKVSAPACTCTVAGKLLPLHLRNQEVGRNEQGTALGGQWPWAPLQHLPSPRGFTGFQQKANVNMDLILRSLISEHQMGVQPILISFLLSLSSKDFTSTHLCC